MILGLSHDTCPVCGKDFLMKKDRTLFHHGPPSRRCPGAGKLGIRQAKWMAEIAEKYALIDGPDDRG